MPVRVTIVAVGRQRAGPLKDAFDDYARRLPSPLKIVEVEEKRSLPPDQIKTSEGKKLLAALPKGAFLIALDGRGKQYTSAGFADAMAGWRERADHLAFAIGGAEGLDAAVLKAAEARLSLGAATWPHMLVRVMLAEQIYRAHTILAGHPYHRG